MLATVASARYRIREMRVTLALAAVVLAVGALVAAMLPPSNAASATVRPFAEELQPASWAMTVPLSWLAAPPPRARAGDAFDLLAIRAGDRVVAAPVAYAVVLLAVDERGLTLQVDQDDAVAIANARGSGMQFIALLRSAR